MRSDREVIDQLRAGIQPKGTQPIVRLDGFWANHQAITDAIDHMESRALRRGVGLLDDQPLNPLEKLALTLLLRQIDKEPS